MININKVNNNGSMTQWIPVIADPGPVEFEWPTGIAPMDGPPMVPVGEPREQISVGKFGRLVAKARELRSRLVAFGVRGGSEDVVYDGRTPSQLKGRVTELNSNEYIIDGLLPKQSLSLLVGESGLGKSPLLYQAAICVAAGKAFLERPTKQGKVLWIDCENGPGDVDWMVDNISKFLRLPHAPENLICWNLNDADGFGTRYNFEDLVRHYKPTWVIIDTLKTIFTKIESENQVAVELYKSLRQMMREVNTTITGVHHPRKRGDKRDVEPLETTNTLMAWFLEASGAKSLITNSDVRIGLEKPSENKVADLVLRGFGRVKNKFPTLLMAREFDENTEDPIGYRLITGADAITYAAHRKLFNDLPHQFRHKDAKTIYGKGSEATTDALKKFVDVTGHDLLPRCSHGNFR